MKVEKSGNMDIERNEIGPYGAAMQVDLSNESVRRLIENQAQGKVRMTALENPNTCKITHIRATDAHDAINLLGDPERLIPCPKESTMIMLSMNTVREVCAVATSWAESTNVESIA